MLFVSLVGDGVVGFARLVRRALRSRTHVATRAAAVIPVLIVSQSIGSILDNPTIPG